MKTMTVCGVVALMVGAAVAAQAATPCEITALAMQFGCWSDVRDDFWEGYANCVNLTEYDDRVACFVEGRDERMEAFDECDDVYDARMDTCERLDEWRYDVDPLTDPAASFVDPDEVPDIHPANPFVSVAAGHTYVLQAGEEGEETVVVHVTDEVYEVLGVPCRVVVDAVVEVGEDDDGGVEYEPVEVTDDWFAQDDAGNVYYCGEISRNFEDGVLRDLDGSFEAGFEGAKSGFLVKAAPAVGDVHRQEYLLGEAEDVIEYVSLAGMPDADMGGDNPDFPCSGGCLQTLDWAPIEPESAEFKFYVADVGFVLAVAMEDGEYTGEREVLRCVGDSLDVLSDAACGIDDAEALLEALCEVSPGAFCGETD